MPAGKIFSLPRGPAGNWQGIAAIASADPSYFRHPPVPFRKPHPLDNQDHRADGEDKKEPDHCGRVTCGYGNFRDASTNHCPRRPMTRMSAIVASISAEIE